MCVKLKFPCVSLLIQNKYKMALMTIQFSVSRGDLCFCQMHKHIFKKRSDKGLVTDHAWGPAMSLPFIDGYIFLVRLSYHI